MEWILTIISSIIIHYQTSIIIHYQTSIIIHYEWILTIKDGDIHVISQLVDSIQEARLRLSRGTTRRGDVLGEKLHQVCKKNIVCMYIYIHTYLYVYIYSDDGPEKNDSINHDKWVYDHPLLRENKPCLDPWHMRNLNGSDS